MEFLEKAKAKAKALAYQLEGVGEWEAKVLEATNSDPWGPHGKEMTELADATHRSSDARDQIVGALFKRLGEKPGDGWRHTYKALNVVEFLVAHGSMRVVEDLRDRERAIGTLTRYRFVEPSGKDQGINVRTRAEKVQKLLSDSAAIGEVRDRALANKNKYSGYSADQMRSGDGGGGGRYGGFGSDSVPSRYDSDDRYGSSSAKRAEDDDDFEDDSKPGGAFSTSALAPKISLRTTPATRPASGAVPTLSGPGTTPVAKATPTFAPPAAPAADLFGDFSAPAAPAPAVAAPVDPFAALDAPAAATPAVTAPAAAAAPVDPFANFAAAPAAPAAAAAPVDPFGNFAAAPAAVPAQQPMGGGMMNGMNGGMGRMQPPPPQQQPMAMFSGMGMGQQQQQQPQMAMGGMQMGMGMQKPQQPMGMGGGMMGMPPQQQQPTQMGMGVAAMGGPMPLNVMASPAPAPSPAQTGAKHNRTNSGTSNALDNLWGDAMVNSMSDLGLATPPPKGRGPAMSPMKPSAF